MNQKYHSFFVLLLILMAFTYSKANENMPHQALLYENAPNWSFSNGPEFPGAKVKSVWETHLSPALLKLYGDFNHGGHYVSANYRLPAPLLINKMFFQIHVSGAMHINVRIHDTTGQVLVFTPLCKSGPSPWLDCVVPFTNPVAHWNGSNNGIVNGKTTRIDLVMDADLYKGKNGKAMLSRVDLYPPTLPLTNDSVIAITPISPDFSKRMGVSIHDLKDTLLLDLLSSGGIAQIRTDLYWHIVENKHKHYNFGPFDPFIDQLKKRNLKAHFILNYNNPIYSDTSHIYFGPQTTTNMLAFAQFCGEAGRHYQEQVATWEIWNEPDQTQFWQPKPNPTHFGQLFQLCADSLIATGTPAKIIPGGVFSWSYSFIQKASENGQLMHASGLSLHPYRKGPPESITLDLNSLRFSTDSLPPAQPVFISEWGYSSTNFSPNRNGHDSLARDQAGINTLKILLTCLQLNAESCILYTGKDGRSDPSNSELNFGLFDVHHHPKPAWNYLHRFLTLLQNYPAFLLHYQANQKISVQFSAPDSTHVVSVTMGDTIPWITFSSNPKLQTK